MEGENTALKSYVDRLISLHKEKKQVQEIMKDLKSEAKSSGIDVKAMDKLVSLTLAKEEVRKQQRDTEDLAKVYAKALGLLNLWSD